MNDNISPAEKPPGTTVQSGRDDVLDEAREQDSHARKAARQKRVSGPQANPARCPLILPK
jgi:hypothetical protein